jgi:hypothetical protein
MKQQAELGAGQEVEAFWELPVTIGDEELAALALAADPDAPLDPLAVPIDLHPGGGDGALPDWYMAPVMARHSGSRFRRAVILTVIGAFLLIEAFGLCSTFGQLPLH